MSDNLKVFDENQPAEPNDIEAAHIKLFNEHAQQIGHVFQSLVNRSRALQAELNKVNQEKATLVSLVSNIQSRLEQVEKKLYNLPDDVVVAPSRPHNPFAYLNDPVKDQS